jgi:hypothetical protein
MFSPYTPPSYTRRTYESNVLRVYDGSVYAPDIRSGCLPRIHRRRIRAGHSIRMSSAYTPPSYTRRTFDPDVCRVYTAVVYAPDIRSGHPENMYKQTAHTRQLFFQSARACRIIGECRTISVFTQCEYAS